jgi:transcriptional regulator with XRE-family HTH domain
LSPGLLSKIERNKMVPTLPTLLRVALVYGVGLDYFFSNAAPQRALGIVRAAERRQFLERLGGRDVAWEFECLDFTATERLMNAYHVRFRQAAARPRLHEHGGAEFLYLLSGKLGIVVAGVEHVLSAGDSMYFDASQPHGYRRLSARSPEALVVTVPA